ncbi:ribonuclease H1-like [Pectinophora gossypiella]|uniref:ribonuclease H1-like n=1 Tax=Pectinophora gossypiella TaxID=13191 RepID=UPI00214ECE9A|nr:ribonuclease H1-like [Pectinophora gossypiella]
MKYVVWVACIAMFARPQPIIRRINNNDFEEDGGSITVYVNGACSKNGQADAQGGFGVFWGENHPLNTSEPVRGRATNNRGEIQGAIRAITQALDNGIPRLTIYTDSQYLINCMKVWISGWKQNNWIRSTGDPVRNQENLQELDNLQSRLQLVEWIHVKAKNGNHGNDEANRLAKAGAAMYQPPAPAQEVEPADLQHLDQTSTDDFDF